MNGANERGSTIDVARDKSSRADRDCERYAIRKIQYNVSLRSFFFFRPFIRVQKNACLSLTIFDLPVRNRGIS